MHVDVDDFMFRFKAKFENKWEKFMEVSRELTAKYTKLVKDKEIIRIVLNPK